MNNFSDLGLLPELLQSAHDLGFKTPTEIQKKTIPVLLEKNTDLIGLAQTGTGKTAAFGLPLIQHTNIANRQTQGLILAPTRELCLQITKELQNYAQYLGKLNIVAIYGGASLTAQEKEINRGAHIIVATPGRMKDMLKRNIINITQIETCILDEADEMLNMGFYDDIVAILKYAPKSKQTWLFSATMPPEVSVIAARFMHQPVEVTVGHKNQSTHNVSHKYFLINAHDRYQALKRIVDFNPDIFAVIFCRTKRHTQQVADSLIEHGYNAAALHGDLSQAQRDSVMKSFRMKQIQLLVATDVAARGIDVDDITHVIHYQLPDETEVYTHRSGRTGRAGKTGLSIALITSKEKKRIKDIEAVINREFEQWSIPNSEEIIQKQLFYRATEIKDTPTHPELEHYLPRLEELYQDLSKSDLLQKIFSAEFSRFSEYYKNAGNLNPAQTGNTADDIRFFISLGSKDGLTWTSLKDLLKKELNLSKEEIFKVDVLNSFSFFNTPHAELKNVTATFKNFSYNGRKIKVEITDNKPSRKPNKRQRSKRRDQHPRKSSRRRSR